MPDGETVTTCPKCGIDNLEGIQTCGVCGTPLKTRPTIAGILHGKAGEVESSAERVEIPTPRGKPEKRLSVTLSLSVAILLVAFGLVFAFYGAGAELSADLEYSVHDNWFGNQTLILVVGEIRNDGVVDGHAIVHIEVFTGYERGDFEKDAGEVPARGSVSFSWAVAYPQVDVGRLHVNYWVTEYESPTA